MPKQQHCLICNLTFTHWNNRPYCTHVLGHVATKLVDRSYFVNTETAFSYWYCQICGFKFSDRDKLHDHLMEQHEDMFEYCTTEWHRNKNENGEAVFIEEYADMGLKRLLASFCIADPERPPDSELKLCTWGRINYNGSFLRIETEVCPICLGGLTLRPRRQLLNCHHTLHAKCLKDLVKSGQRHCPICRVEMDKYDGANYEYPDDPELIL